MFVDFFVVESASNPGEVGFLRSVETRVGFVPRVGEYCCVPGVGTRYIVHQVTTNWVPAVRERDVNVPSGLRGTFVPRVRVDLRY